MGDQENKFIIIDDDPLSNRICKLTLDRVFNKPAIQIFTNPEAGLDYIRSEYEGGVLKNTVLFLDINMPIMSGWDFLQHFKMLEGKIKNCFTIYILSSSVDASDVERAKADKDIKKYLVKPITVDIINALAIGSEPF
jgi:CheY-like chemotaxis protein